MADRFKQKGRLVSQKDRSMKNPSTEQESGSLPYNTASLEPSLLFYDLGMGKTIFPVAGIFAASLL